METRWMAMTAIANMRNQETWPVMIVYATMGFTTRRLEKGLIGFYGLSSAVEL